MLVMHVAVGGYREVVRVRDRDRPAVTAGIH